MTSLEAASLHTICICNVIGFRPSLFQMIMADCFKNEY